MRSGVSATSCVAGTSFGTSDAVNSAGYAFSIDFGTVGTFYYHCVQHCGSGMRGTINGMASW